MQGVAHLAGMNSGAIAIECSTIGLEKCRWRLLFENTVRGPDSWTLAHLRTNWVFGECLWRFSTNRDLLMATQLHWPQARLRGSKSFWPLYAQYALYASRLHRVAGPPPVTNRSAFTRPFPCSIVNARFISAVDL